MKIKLEELNKYIKQLSNIPYVPLKDKFTIFFEIDTTKVVDREGFVLDMKEKESTTIVAKPGLILSCDTTGKKPRTVVSLGYANITYSPKFNLESYFDILGVKMPTKERKMLTDLDALLIKDEYILGEFEL